MLYKCDLLIYYSKFKKQWNLVYILSSLYNYLENIFSSKNIREEVI